MYCIFTLLIHILSKVLGFFFEKLAVMTGSRAKVNLRVRMG